MKKITRTYVTKSGKTVTKTYLYSKKYVYKRSLNKSTLLIDRRGGIRRKAVQRFKDQIMDQAKNGKIGYDEAQYTIDELDYYLEERAGQKKQLRVSGFLGHLADTATDRMFANAGSNIDDEAMYLGVSTDVLRDPNNWRDGIFTNPFTNIAYSYVFGYGGYAQWQQI